jgi:hypothetical protein
MERVEKTNEEWKSILSPEEFQVLRLKGTERGGTGKYNKFNEKGTYLYVVVAAMECLTRLLAGALDVEQNYTLRTPNSILDVVGLHSMTRFLELWKQLRTTLTACIESKSTARNAEVAPESFAALTLSEVTLVTSSKERDSRIQRTSDTASTV